MTTNFYVLLSCLTTTIVFLNCFEQWNLDSLSMFYVLYKLFYIHNRSKDVGHYLMQKLFENVHTVREEKTTWSRRLPCAFFQYLPSGIPFRPPIIMMSYSIHQNSPSVVPCTPKCPEKGLNVTNITRILQAPVIVGQIPKPSRIGVRELLARGCD